jgi:predicted Zn finger-like uncharacterized protein
MIVTCHNCSTRLRLDGAKIPSRPFSVRCPKCQQIVNAQPTSAPQQRDALSAVGDVPATTRAQAETSATPAVPLADVEALPDDGEPPAREVLRLLGALLRGEQPAELKGAKRRALDGKRVLVCVGSPAGQFAARTLADGGYLVHVAGNTEQALERMREERVDVLVLDPDFDAGRQGAASVGAALAAMRMPERRRVVFVHLSATERTGDAHAAFLAGANLFVNNGDVAELPRAVERNVRDLNELYRHFNKALGFAEL